MHAIEYLRNPSKVSPKPVYAVFGDDPFLRREALESIAGQVLQGEDKDLSILRFDGALANLADVLDEARTLPFFSKRKVVIVEGADPFVTAHRKELEAYVEHPATAGTLVLLVKTWPATTKLAKLVEKAGLAVDCKCPAERELVAWLTHRAKAREGVALEDDAARLLLELVGPEIGLLVSEVAKLAVYVGDRAPIRRADVATMVGAGRIESIWKVLDAATTGNGVLALEHLDRLVASGEHPVGLLAAMSFSLLKLHHAGQLRRARRQLDEACREAGIAPFAVKQTQLQHAHLGPTRVDRLPAMLLQADLDVKGSSMLAPRVVLERLVVQLARPRED